MESLRAKSSSGVPIQELFLGKRIVRWITEEKPRRGGITVEFDDGSCLYVWFETIDLEAWEVTGALRVTDNFSASQARGVSNEPSSKRGFQIRSVSLLRVDFDSNELELCVDNGLVLCGDEDQSITIVSSSGAGTTDVGLDCELNALETEYPAQSYRLVGC